MRSVGIRRGQASTRLPGRGLLRVRLAAAAVCLVAAGAAIIGSASVLVARDGLMRQADQQLRAYAALLVSHPFTAAPSSRLAPGPGGPGGGGSGIEVLSSAGRLVMRAGHIPVVAGTVVAGTGRLASVSAYRGGDWIVIAEPVHYRAQRILFTYGDDDFSLLIARPDRPGLAGTLIVGLALSGVDRVIGRLAVTWLAISGAAALAVAFLGVMAMRALLGQIEHRFSASATSEAAARTSTLRLSRDILETGHKLQRPLSVIHGFTEYYRQRGRLSPGELDHMMRRVAAEAARLDALIDDLPPTRHDQPCPPQQ